MLITSVLYSFAGMRSPAFSEAYIQLRALITIAPPPLPYVVIASSVRLSLEPVRKSFETSVPAWYEPLAAIVTAPVLSSPVLMSVDVDYLIERMDGMRYCDFCRSILVVYWWLL